LKIFWVRVTIMKALSISSVLLLAVSAAAPAAKAPARPAAAQSFGESVDVSVVNVEVYATDKSGHRVTGLSKDDFELLEDGKKVPISNFEVVAADAPTAAAIGPTAGPDAARAPEDAVNLVVYFDDFNIRPANRARAVRQLGDFLAHKLAPGDRVMLVTYDLGLHVRFPFTSDPAVIAKGLEEISTLATHGSESDHDRNQAFQSMMDIQRDSLSDPIDPVPCPQNIVTPAQAYAAGRRQEVLRTISTLTVLVNSLSGVPGRKALLHVSDGLPLNPGEELFEFLLELCGGQGNGAGQRAAPENPGAGKFGGDKNPDELTVYDSASLGPKSYQAASQAMLDAQSYSVAKSLQSLAAHANAQRVTFYMLQASGLQAPNTADAATGPADRLLQSFGVGNSLKNNHQDSLQLLADGTGGRSILNTNDFLPDLSRMREDLASFYSLGFAPPHAGDGSEHKLEVRSRRPGIRLRYRQSYRDKPAIEKVVDRTLAALFYGIEDNPLEIKMEIGDLAPAEGGKLTVPVRLRIPLFKLAILKQEENFEGKLRVLVATRDETGGTSPVRQIDVPLRIPRKEVLNAMGQYYVYTLTLQMKPGLQHVAVAVRDEIAAATSYLGRPITVTATASVTHP
jgi:VWFA-related protein